MSALAKTASAKRLLRMTAPRVRWMRSACAMKISTNGAALTSLHMLNA